MGDHTVFLEERVEALPRGVIYAYVHLEQKKFWQLKYTRRAFRRAIDKNIELKVIAENNATVPNYLVVNKIIDAQQLSSKIWSYSFIIFRENESWIDRHDALIFKEKNWAMELNSAKVKVRPYVYAFEDMLGQA